LSVILLVFLTDSLMAQESGRSLWSGYLFVGPASREHGYTQSGGDGGIGMEYIAAKGVGFGTEFGRISQIGVFSANGVYRIPLKRKLIPFVTAGYAGAFDSDGDTGSGFNFGAGANYSFTRRLGIRAEVREFTFSNHALSNFPSFRFGITF